ncbi:MAG: 5-(carboxyamino)imidazole ribonucleotide synthase [Flammeovirgaceae bacterium]
MSLTSDVRVGVLGGGQLGRMLIQSGINFNFRFKVLDPNPEAPCSRIAHEFVSGSLVDYDTVMAFGQDVDVLTIEIEKVNTQALEDLAKQGIKVYPQAPLVRMIQDKRTQKQFYQQHNIPTSDFILIENKAELANHLDFLPAVQKLGKDGYDGKGVQILRTADDLTKGFDAPSLIEKLVDIEKELSVIVARNERGEVDTFPLVECVYHPEHNLVDYLMSPAEVPTKIEYKAKEIAVNLVEKMDFVGLLAVELFWDKNDNVLVNEIAPRPHNSGHHSIEGNYTSQYEQLLRAILNLPMGNTAIREPAAMLNILGEAGYTGPAKYEGMSDVLALHDVYVHLYGKTVTKPFRKMGHVTIMGKNKKDLIQKMDVVKEKLKVIA